jgi:flavin reductase (DIM6/NTAB) family NADH-FMN oxidoreductase RutF
MAKVTLGPRTILYPLPTILVGANVSGKPNFMAAAWCGIVNSRPPFFSVSLQYPRYTLKGILENNTFSINVPSQDIVAETDYCGIYSGKDTDKVADCKFNVFYGKTKSVPMVTECPINIECRVTQTILLPSHTLIIGECAEVFATDSCLTDGEPDIEKIKPFLWGARPGDDYWSFGKPIAKGHAIGKELKK